MKRLKFYLITMLLPFCFMACEDDKKTEDSNEGGGVPATSKVEVSFVSEGATALRNAGTIRIPVQLSAAAEGTVKFSVAVVPPTDTRAAKEGYDFQVVEKVVNIETGKTENFVEISLLDNEQVTEDKEFEMEISSVYGYGKKGAENQRCKITIVSNSFVEFEKAAWLTWEAATVSGDADVRNTRRVPLKINGTVTEPTVLTVGVSDQTAIEYAHFQLVSKKITVNPGDETVYVELRPVDDAEPNVDRTFALTLESAEGGNLRLGKNNLTCTVTIQSEEVLKVASFQLTEVPAPEDVVVVELTIVLDKVPDEDVTFTLEAVDGTALAGTNYELASPTVVLPEGSQRKTVQIEIKKDGLCTPDLEFEIKLTDAEGSSVALSDDKSSAKVVIENRDYPAFAAASVQVFEGSQAYKIALSLENPAPADIPLILSLEEIEGVAGTDFELLTPEVTIPAGETSVDVEVRMGVTLAEFKASKFAVILGTCLAKAVATEVKTEVEAKENTGYRKYLGTWTFSGKGYSSATAYTIRSFDVTIMIGRTDEEIAANFGKKLLCKGFTNLGTLDPNYYWSLNFDAETGKVLMNFGRQEGQTTWSSLPRSYWMLLGSAFNSAYNNLTTTGYAGYFDYFGELNSQGTEITFPNTRNIFWMCYYSTVDAEIVNGFPTTGRTLWSGYSFKEVTLTKK